MDDAAVAAWLERYVAAWRSYDPEAIGDLFTEDAVYRWHPYDEGEEAVHGRDAIVAAWMGDRDEPGSWSAQYRPWAVEGDRAAAVGVSTYFEPDGKTVNRVYHNVFLMRFDGDGRCAEFTELFMREQDRAG
jgi:uncharacterized protein (TIGR02246 family)